MEAAKAEVAFSVQGVVATAVVAGAVVAEKRVALAAAVAIPVVSWVARWAAGRPVVYWAEEVWAEEVKVEEEVAGAATVAANLVARGGGAAVVVGSEGTVAEMEAAEVRGVLAAARAAVEERAVEAAEAAMAKQPAIA